MAIAIAALAGLISAASCPEIVGRWGYGTTEALAADAEHLYVGCGTILQIFGLQDPAHPAKLYELMLAGQIRGITLAQKGGKSFAFIAGSRAGLIIVDVSVASSPMVVGSLDTPFYVHDVAIQGDLAIIADEDYGSWTGNYSTLKTVNIQDVTHPKELGSILTGSIEGVAVNGQYAYAATLDGLQIFNIADPTDPCLAGAYQWDSFAMRVKIQTAPGDKLLAYVCDASSGLWIIDVTNPSSPTLHGTFDWFQAYDVSFVNSLAYIAAYFDGFVIADIADPANPLWIGYLSTTQRMQAVAHTSGNYAYLADFSGLVVADTNDPTWPTQTERIAAGAFWSDVITDGTLAYVSGSDEGISILDFSDAASPRKIGSFDSYWQAIGLAKQGSILYVADGYGISILNVADPTTPIEIAYYVTHCSALRVAVRDKYAYVACSSGGLRILDVSDPIHPNEVGSFESLDYAISICTYGHYVVIADWTVGIHLIDVLDPAHPREVWRLSRYFAHDVAVSNGKAYVAYANGSLVVIDLSDPETPSILGSIEVPGNPEGIAIRGNIAFVAAWDDGWLRAYDIANPTAIRELGFVETPGYPGDVAISGDMLVATDAGAGVTFHRIDGCGFDHQRPLTKP